MANGHSTKKHEEKAIATKEEKVNAVTKASDFDYSDYAGQGFENQTRDDLSVPFLGIIQSNSPILETKAEARAGMLVNTVSQDVFDGKEGVVFVPVKTEKYFVEWKPRTLGGGFVKMHAIDSEIVLSVTADQEFGKYKMVKGDANSNDLVQTNYVYGILANEYSNQPIIIAFTSTKIKAYKDWMNKANSIQVKLPDGRVLLARRDLPLFAHKYRIHTIAQKNAKGSFYNFSISLDGSKESEARLSKIDPLFEAAVKFYETLAEGKVSAAYDSAAKTSGVEDEEIPFK